MDGALVGAGSLWLIDISWILRGGSHLIDIFVD